MIIDDTKIETIMDVLSISDGGILILTKRECGRFIGLVLDNLSYIHFYSNNLIVF